MSDQTGQPTLPTVRVFATIAEVYAFVWQGRTEFLNLIFPAALILSLLQVAIGARAVAADPDSAQAAGLSWPLVILLILNIIFVTMVAVAWHRRFLLPDEHPGYLQQFQWRKRHFRFVFLTIKIVLLAVLLAIVPLIVVGSFSIGAAFPMTVAVMIGVYLILVRLMLTLPASAIDRKLTLREAWQLGTRNSWRLVSLTLLANVPISLGSWLILTVLFLMIGDGPGWPNYFGSIWATTARPSRCGLRLRFPASSSFWSSVPSLTHQRSMYAASRPRSRITNLTRSPSARNFRAILNLVARSWSSVFGRSLIVFSFAVFCGFVRLESS